MKAKITLILIVVLSLSIKINAQEQPKTYHEKMKVLMSNLDSTNFKNNTLYNRVYPLSRLQLFNHSIKMELKILQTTDILNKLYMNYI